MDCKQKVFWDRFRKLDKKGRIREIKARKGTGKGIAKEQGRAKCFREQG